MSAVVTRPSNHPRDSSWHLVPLLGDGEDPGSPSFFGVRLSCGRTGDVQERHVGCRLLRKPSAVGRRRARDGEGGVGRQQQRSDRRTPVSACERWRTITAAATMHAQHAGHHISMCTHARTSTHTSAHQRTRGPTRTHEHTRSRACTGDMFVAIIVRSFSTSSSVESLANSLGPHLSHFFSPFIAHPHTHTQTHIREHTREHALMGCCRPFHVKSARFV